MAKKRENKSFFPIWRKIALSAVLAATILPVWPAAASQSGDKMEQVLELLSQHHLSGTSEESLSDTAIKAMVESLNDPYTVYMNKKEVEQFMNSLSRSYVGVGMLIGQAEDGIYIDQVFRESPAAGADLKSGDFIVKVNDTEAAGLTTDQLVSFIMGEEDTSVSITVRRDGSILTKTMPRKPISLPVLESAFFDGGVGYIKLHSFSADADEKFVEALNGMKEKSEFRSLVIDLRDNPGGLLDSALQIAAQFVKDGVLMHTRDRAGKDNPIEVHGGGAMDIPVYVLVNEYSASASEVLSGALQDYGAATIVGAKTYGKGSVQVLYDLSDGSKLKVTVEEYMTPKGNKVNQTGISPDMPVEGDLNQLLMTLRQAGVQDFRLKKERSSLFLNGIRVTDPLPAFQSDGRLWIHSRVLAALAGAEIRWIPESQAVELTIPGSSEKTVFGTAGGEALFDGGLLFIDAEAFTRKFPQLKIHGNLTNLELLAGKG